MQRMPVSTVASNDPSGCRRRCWNVGGRAEPWLLYEPARRLARAESAASSSDCSVVASSSPGAEAHAKVEAARKMAKKKLGRRVMVMLSEVDAARCDIVRKGTQLVS